MTTKILGDQITAYTINTEQLSNTATAAFAKTLAPKILYANVTSNTYSVLDDTAVNVGGGFIVITGAEFQSGATVLIDTVAASAVTYVNSTTLRAQVPARSAASYNLYVVNPDGGTGLKVAGITYSSEPFWVTTSPLANVTSNTIFSGNVSATGATSYANTTILPTGFTLLANGYYYGNISVGTATTYNFDIKATDAELQDSTKTFSLTATTVLLDPYWNNVILLLNGDGSDNGTTFTDSSPLAWSTSSINTPQTKTSIKKFGTASIYLTGSNKVSLPITTSYNLNDAFTIEMWLYINSFGSGETIHILEAADNGGLDLQYAHNRPSDSPISNYSFRLGGTNLTWGSYSNQSVLNTGQWYHYAATATSGSSNITHWLDGVSIGSRTRGTATYAIPGIRLNGNNTGTGQYYIDDLRITRGVARYSSTFTPPTNQLGQFV